MPGTKAGGPVRSIYSLTALLKDHYDFYIITTDRDLGSDTHYTDIKPGVFFEKEGITYYYFPRRELKVETVLEKITVLKPALVYINSFWSYFFSISIVKAAKSGRLQVPLLLAPRGMLSSGALGLKAVKKQVFLFLARLSGWYKKVAFHATNEEERADILRQFKHARVFVAPNVNSGIVYSLAKPKEVNRLKLFYLSRVARVKNLHFALEILNSVPASVTIQYDIFGNLEDKEYWAMCQKLIEKLPLHIKVVYRDELQFNEVQPTIVSYHALFLPTLNENFGHSIVESLLCGCPVIISDQTPWNDVENANAGYAGPLDNRQGFVNSIVQLAALSQNDYAIKSAAAIRYISDKLNIAKSIEQYKNVFDDPVKN